MTWPLTSALWFVRGAVDRVRFTARAAAAAAAKGGKPDAGVVAAAAAAVPIGAVGVLELGSQAELAAAEVATQVAETNRRQMACFRRDIFIMCTRLTMQVRTSHTMAPSPSNPPTPTHAHMHTAHDAAHHYHQSTTHANVCVRTRLIPGCVSSAAAFSRLHCFW